MELTGIYWDAERESWLTQFFYQGRTIHLGRFETLGEAKRARERAKRLYNDSRRIPPRPQQSKLTPCQNLKNEKGISSTRR